MKRLEASAIAQKSSRDFRENYGYSQLDSIAPFERDEIILGRRIGSGAYSFVYEIAAFCLRLKQSSVYTDEQNEKRKVIAQSVSKGAKYVMKCLKDDLEHGEDDGDLFIEAAHDIVNEAELLAALSHPNIIKLHGVVASRHEAFLDGASSFFIVLERLDCTLADKIEGWANEKNEESSSLSAFLKPLTSVSGFRSRVHNSGDVVKLEKSSRFEARARDDGCIEKRFRVAASLARAVEWLHSKGIIFRDLKPHNIGFDSKNCLKLFDFGLARFMPHNGNMSGAGTPRYSAPEGFFFGSANNTKTDVYSFGVVFWEIMSLKKPFAKCKNRKQLGKALLKVDKVLGISNRRWPKSIQQVIRKSLSDQSERPTMSEVRTVIDGCISQGDFSYVPVITDAFTPKTKYVALLSAISLNKFTFKHSMSADSSTTAETFQDSIDGLTQHPID